MADDKPDLRQTDWKGLCQLGLLSLIPLAFLSILPVVHHYYGRQGLFRVFEFLGLLFIGTSLISRSVWRYRSVGVGFSVWHTLVATTVIAIYVTAWRSISPSEWRVATSVLAWFYTLNVGAIFAEFAYYIVSNRIYFVRLPNLPPAEEKRLLVKPRVEALPHIAVAISVLGAALLLRLTFGPVHSVVTLIWIGVAIRSHAIAYERTAIWELSDGVRLLDKRWRWEDGPLRLIEVAGQTRLVPKEKAEAGWPPLTWWPLIREEHLEALRELLDTKQAPPKDEAA